LIQGWRIRNLLQLSQFKAQGSSHITPVRAAKRNSRAYSGAQKGLEWLGSGRTAFTAVFISILNTVSRPSPFGLSLSHDRSAYFFIQVPTMAMSAKELLNKTSNVGEFIQAREDQTSVAEMKGLVARGAHPH
jgi:hypothetical protein